MKPKAEISAFFQASLPIKPGNAYAKQKSSNAPLGKRRVAAWETMAGLGWFTLFKCGSRQKKSSAVTRAAFKDDQAKT
jgi:hypothetical protein